MERTCEPVQVVVGQVPDCPAAIEPFTLNICWAPVPELAPALRPIV